MKNKRRPIQNDILNEYKNYKNKEKSSQNIKIRPLTLGDYNAFYILSLRIIDDISRYYPKEIFGNYQARFAGYFRGALLNSSAYAAGAFLDNEPVGLIVGEEIQKLLHVELVGTCPRNGAAALGLLSVFEKEARRRRLYRVYLHTSLKNVRAIKFFKKAGYEIDWALKNFWHGWHYAQLSKQIYTKKWGEIENSPNYK